MRCVIVTGMSGAGKSTALKMLEDMGYFCVDNLPVPLIPKMAELLSVPGTEINKAALGVDIRSGQNFYELTLHTLLPHGLAATVKTQNRPPATAGQFMRQAFPQSARPFICPCFSMMQYPRSIKAASTWAVTCSAAPMCWWSAATP